MAWVEKVNDLPGLDFSIQMLL